MFVKKEENDKMVWGFVTYGPNETLVISGECVGGRVRKVCRCVRNMVAEECREGSEIR